MWKYILCEKKKWIRDWDWVKEADCSLFFIPMKTMNQFSVLFISALEAWAHMKLHMKSKIWINCECGLIKVNCLPVAVFTSRFLTYLWFLGVLVCPTYWALYTWTAHEAYICDIFQWWNSKSRHWCLAHHSVFKFLVEHLCAPIFFHLCSQRLGWSKMANLCAQ